MANSTKLKCVLVGDDGIGKSCTIITFSWGNFPEYVPTVMENHEIQRTIDEDLYSMEMWDTVSPVEYDTLRPLCYHEAHVFLVLYSVVNRDSFDHVTTRWIPEIRRIVPNALIVLGGTKLDLRTSELSPQQLVTTEDGQKLAKQLNAIAFIEFSSKESQGLNEVYDLLFGTAAEAYQQAQNSSKKSNCTIS
jgi:small GTP-binding protein